MHQKRGIKKQLGHVPSCHNVTCFNTGSLFLNQCLANQLTSSSGSNSFISKNTKDTRANYSSEFIVILSTNFGIL